MITDLSTLVAPLTELEFLRCLRERKLTFVRNASPDHFASLLEWEGLNQLVGGSIYPLSDLHVLRESIPIPAPFFVKDGRIDPLALSKLMDQGVSLLFTKLQDYVPELQRLSQSIAERTGELITAGAIVTSGRGGALERHFDREDLVLLQIAGSKRWHIYGDPVANPVKGMPAQKPPAGPPIFDEVLTPGDFLYLPAGYWHHCENGPDRSLHVGIFFDPPNGRHVMTALADQGLSDERFRRPLTRHGTPDTLLAHETAIKAHLVERVQQWSLADFLAEYAAWAQPTRPIRLEGRPSHLEKA